MRMEEAAAPRRRRSNLPPVCLRLERDRPREANRPMSSARQPLIFCSDSSLTFNADL